MTSNDRSGPGTGFNHSRSSKRAGRSRDLPNMIALFGVFSMKNRIHDLTSSVGQDVARILVLGHGHHEVFCLLETDVWRKRSDLGISLDLENDWPICT